MNRPINFLPWRQTQRAACLRRWGALFAGAFVAIVGASFCRHVAVMADNRAGEALLEAEIQRGAALQAARPRLQARHLQWQEAQRKEQQREETRRWQSALQTLAATLPAQAWLTRMDFQQEALTLAGLATNLTALAELETSLRRQPAFQLSKTGATRQDAGGRWQFHYQLIRQDDGARAH